MLPKTCSLFREEGGYAYLMSLINYWNLRHGIGQRSSIWNIQRSSMWDMFWHEIGQRSSMWDMLMYSSVSRSLNVHFSFYFDP